MLTIHDLPNQAKRTAYDRTRPEGGEYCNTCSHHWPDRCQCLMQIQRQLQPNLLVAVSTDSNKHSSQSAHLSLPNNKTAKP